jgi:hypothetical protein
LQARCLEKLPKTTGRMVVLNDYAAEYAAACANTSTTAYQQIRREHGAIERKLVEVVCQHDGRRARWGDNIFSGENPR